MAEDIKAEATINQEETTPTHPYQDRVKTFEPHEWQLVKQMPNSPPSIEETKCTYVDSKMKLDEMMGILNKEKEFAIGLESESFLRFKGICCIISICTRSETYLVDAPKLRTELKSLNSIFADTSKLKVVHRGQRYLEMLQKDLGLFVINMFDTYTAGTLLQEKKAMSSVKELVREFCFEEFVGAFHQADWQQRPLPEDMVTYARQTVHYLLYCYDCLRNTLIDKKQIREAYRLTTQISGLVADPAKDRLTPTKYLNSYNKMKKGIHFNKQQLECYRLLFNWRHEISEKNDRSLGYTLANEDLVQIVKKMPRDVESIAGCCRNCVLPPTVRDNLQTVHELILKAVENVPDNSPEAKQVVRKPKWGPPHERGSTQNSDRDSNKRHSLETGHGGQSKRGRGAFRGVPFSGRGAPYPGRGHPPFHWPRGGGPHAGRGGSFPSRGGPMFTGFSVMRDRAGY